MKPDCVFCKIVTGDAPSYKVWESSSHLAFLSIFPNTEGVTVVIPKEHQPSYIFEASSDVMNDLMTATREVALLLDTKFEDVGRTGLIFEGFGVDHLHAKLFPMHGTRADKWEVRNSSVDKYFDVYEGYLSSHDYKRADDGELDNTARKLGA